MASFWSNDLLDFLGLGRKEIFFRMHRMILDLFRFNWTEGTQTYGQSEIVNSMSILLQFFQYLRCEV